MTTDTSQELQAHIVAVAKGYWEGSNAEYRGFIAGYVAAADKLPELEARLERADAWSRQQAIESEQLETDCERLLAALDILGANADAFHQQQHKFANQTCGIECEGVTEGVAHARALLAEMEATDD